MVFFASGAGSGLAVVRESVFHVQEADLWGTNLIAALRRHGDKPTKWQRMLISDWPVIRKPSLPQSCSAEEAGGQQRSGIASIDSLDRVCARKLVPTPGLQALNSNGRMLDVTNHQRAIGIRRRHCRRCRRAGLPRLTVCRRSNCRHRRLCVRLRPEALSWCGNMCALRKPLRSGYRVLAQFRSFLTATHDRDLLLTVAK
jgi:hypothetical protein